MEGWLLVVVMTMVKKDVPVSVIVPSTVTTVIMVMIMMLLSCLGTASFPPLSFNVTACREPHPTFRVSCSEMGHFPMEWFYSPLFDVTHMRTLLVRHLEVECRFE
ncbi:unnamed protein product, partial [Symbiodinium sp. KB8]